MPAHAASSKSGHPGIIVAVCMPRHGLRTEIPRQRGGLRPNRGAGEPPPDSPMRERPVAPTPYREHGGARTRKWHYHFITPDGQVIREGASPYSHGGHPYVFKAYPFIDGEIHSFVSDIIDQQKVTNRLISMYDWILRASAKGVLLFPEESLPQRSMYRRHRRRMEPLQRRNPFPGPAPAYRSLSRSARSAPTSA